MLFMLPVLKQFCSSISLLQG